MKSEHPNSIRFITTRKGVCYHGNRRGDGRMNKKGEVSVGLIILTFLAVIVGLVLLTSWSPFIGITSDTVSLVNSSVTVPAVGACVDLTGQELLSTPQVNNASSGKVISNSGNINFTISERVSSVDGLKRIAYCHPVTAVINTSQVVNVSYYYGAEGYVEDGGSRSIIGLIGIFAALAIAIAALVPTIREKFI